MPKKALTVVSAFFNWQNQQICTLIFVAFAEAFVVDRN